MPNIYRQYEDPYKLEKRLAELKEQRKHNPNDEDLAIEINDLEQRINFAWQDDEYESEGY
jgi:hypothetical protein